MDYSKHFNKKQTPPTSPIPGKDQILNSQGGYVFKTSDWNILDRFLVLGSEGGTFYVSESKLTRDGAQNVIKCIKQDGLRVVNRIVEISEEGRAPKNDPAIFALALCTSEGDLQTKKAAYAAIKRVCRTGTHLFTFCSNIQNLRGWSKGLAKGISKFYLEPDVNNVAYQIVKYRQRDGWTHRDVMRLAHPKTKQPPRNELFKYAVGKTTVENRVVPPMVEAFEKVQTLENNPKEAIKLIEEFNLPREALPTQLLNNPNVWEALLQRMPLTALIRSLGKMSNVGLITGNTCTATRLIVSKLEDKEYLKRSRIHPLGILNAMNTYSSGQGMKGSLTWDSCSAIVDVLDSAFYNTFDNVTPTNQRWMLALDVSGSMTWQNIAGMNITPAVASAALSLITANVEKFHEMVGFSSQLVPINISPKQRLDDVQRAIAKVAMGGTDCSKPMLHALQSNLEIDTFVIYTDNESYYGKMHPSQALELYRKESGIPAKLIVVGMTSTGFTIADPTDPGMLDVVGFSTDTPSLISQFSMS